MRGCTYNRKNYTKKTSDRASKLGHRDVTRVRISADIGTHNKNTEIIEIIQKEKPFTHVTHNAIQKVYIKIVIVRVQDPAQKCTSVVVCKKNAPSF